MGIKVGDGFWEIDADLSKLNKSLDKSQKNVKGFGNKLSAGMKKTGKAMTVAGVAGTAAIGGMIVKAASFGTKLGEINTLGIKDLDGLGDAVKDVSARFGQDLSEAAQGAYQAISAGASELEAPLVLEKAAIAATAGLSDMETAITLGMGTMNAFGKSTADLEGIFDQTFVAVKAGVTNFGELAAGAGKLAPLMNAVSLSSDEMFGSVAALTKQMIPTSEAFTGLKAVISNILKPGESAVKMAKELSIEFNATALAEKGLEQFMVDLTEATGGNIDSMTALFGSVEALNTVLALTNETGASDFNEIMIEMRTNTGQAKEAFDAFTENNVGFMFDQLKASATVLAVELGQVLIPEMIKLVEWLKPVISDIREWITANPNLTSTIVKTTAALSFFMVTAGPLLILLPGIATAFGAVTSTIGFFTGGAWAASTAVGSFGLAGAVTKATFAARGLSLMMAGPLIATLGFVVLNVAMVTKAFINMRNAQEETKESEVRLVGQLLKLVEQVEASGVAVDRSALAADTYEESLQNLKDQVTAAEEAQGKELHTINGVTDARWKEITALMEEENAVEDTTVAHQAFIPKAESVSFMLNRINMEAAQAAFSLHKYNQELASSGGMGPGGFNTIPGLARGGIVTRPGAVMVGEQGPELLSLPSGAQVTPLNNTGGGGAGGLGGIKIDNIIINGSGISDPNVLINVISEQLGEAIFGQLRASGVPI